MEGNLSENNNIWKQFKKIKAYLKQSYYLPMEKKKMIKLSIVTILNEIDLAMKLLPL